MCFRWLICQGRALRAETDDLTRLVGFGRKGVNSDFTLESILRCDQAEIAPTKREAGYGSGRANDPMCSPSDPLAIRSRFSTSNHVVTARRLRVEMLFPHLKRILKFDR